MIDLLAAEPDRVVNRNGNQAFAAASGDHIGYGGSDGWVSTVVFTMR